MSTAVAPRTSATPSAPSVPPATPWWKKGSVRLTAVLVVSLLVLVAVIGAMFLATWTKVDYDPESPAPGGAAALGVLVANQGVQVTRSGDVESAAAALRPGQTLAVTEPGELDLGQWNRLLERRPSDVVLFQPTAATLIELDLPAQRARDRVGETAPACADPAATRAGTLQLNGAATYVPTSPAATGCYGDANGMAYLRIERDGVRFHLVGGGGQNRELDLAGNASFTMAVLGQHEQLVWLTAPPAARGPKTKPHGPRLLPPGWTYGWMMAGVAFLVVGVWRGRRLGPILSERLPVKVPASETVEGHGRLYHRIRAYQRAGDELRQASLRRLARLCGQTDPQVLAGLVADQAHRPLTEVRRTLLGPLPTSDAELVDFKKNLDAIEQEVRQL